MLASILVGGVLAVLPFVGLQLFDPVAAHLVTLSPGPTGMPGRASKCPAGHSRKESADRPGDPAGHSLIIAYWTSPLPTNPATPGKRAPA